MSASDTHDELSREWIMRVAGRTEKSSEMMVVVESAMAGAMMILRRVYGLPPSVCTEMIETAVGQATARFARVEAEHGR